MLYNIGFAIHHHESSTGVHVFPIVNQPPHTIPLGHPSAPALSILYHALNLVAIRFIYDNIHVSMPFSQMIPPSPSPTESKRLFYTSVSLLLSCIQGYHYHLSKSHHIDQISRSVLSDSLRPHESKHTRPPCPSPTPGVHSDSRPSSQ